jgi:hypothetical protein
MGSYSAQDAASAAVAEAEAEAVANSDLQDENSNLETGSVQCKQQTLNDTYAFRSERHVRRQ